MFGLKQYIAENPAKCLLVSLAAATAVATFTAGAGRRLLSYSLTRLNRVDPRDESLYRKPFENSPIELRKPSPTNHHGAAASLRNAATTFISDMALECPGPGFPFVEGLSRPEIRNAGQGNRLFYWAKDLDKQYVYSPKHAKQLVSMVDVDYYLPMPDYLSRANPTPVCLYTLTPTAAGSSDGENQESFHFNKDGTVTVHVAGATEFRHHLWNYYHDAITTSAKFFGIPYRTTTYRVVRRGVSQHRSLIMLLPTASFGLFGSLLQTFVDSVPLVHFNPIVVKTTYSGPKADVPHTTYFTRIKVVTATGVMMSTGSPGSFGEVTVPIEQDEAVARLSRTGANHLKNPSVKSLIGLSVEKSLILTEYYRDGYDAKNAIVYGVDVALRGYQFSPKNFDAEAKPLMVAYMSPLIHMGFAPDRCRHNDEAMVQGRVKGVVSDCPMTHHMARLAHEFIIRAFVKDSVTPTDLDEVYERQPRPGQRQHFDEYCQSGSYLERFVKVFTKSEAYQGPKDPRPISTIIPRDKIEYSRYMYPFAEQLKMCPWYAFGLSPRNIAERVADCLRTARTATNSDFHRFDGTISSAVRSFERMMMVHVVPEKHHTEILSLMETQYGQNCFTSFGIAYFSPFARLSGSPETAAFNSPVNAFVAFVAKCYSNDLNTGHRHTYDSAYASLGIYGGDDGLTPDVDSAAFIRAARCMGLTLECDVVKRGQPGVSFLARLYSPEVFDGSPNSMCDVKRQLSKFHLTSHLSPEITAQDKLVAKCRAYVLDDAETPLIGDFVSRIVAGTADYGDVSHLDPITPYMSRCVPENEHYPNEREEWMFEQVDKDLPTFDWTLFYGTLDSFENLEDFLHFPCCVPEEEVLAKQPVVVDGETIIEAFPKAPSTTENVAKANIVPKTKPKTKSTPPVPKGKGKRAARGSAGEIKASKPRSRKEARSTSKQVPARH